jgi:hypothetical protein
VLIHVNGGARLRRNASQGSISWITILKFKHSRNAEINFVCIQNGNNVEDYMPMISIVAYIMICLTFFADVTGNRGFQGSRRHNGRDEIYECSSEPVVSRSEDMVGTIMVSVWIHEWGPITKYTVKYKQVSPQKSSSVVVMTCFSMPTSDHVLTDLGQLQICGCQGQGFWTMWVVSRDHK